jgi:glucose-6-phosphate 1-epimerase
MSPTAVLDASTPIRGGIPIAFPGFGMHKEMWEKFPHPFIRGQYFKYQEPTGEISRDCIKADFQLEVIPGTIPNWTKPFLAEVTVNLKNNGFMVFLSVLNTGVDPLPYQAAFHTYFAVGNLQDTKLLSLPAEFLDATDNMKPAGDAMLQPPVNKAFNRHYYGRMPNENVAIQDLANNRHIFLSHSGPDIVAWNPGPEHAFADIPQGGEKQFICIGAADIAPDAERVIQPGQKMVFYQQVWVIHNR